MTRCEWGLASGLSVLAGYVYATGFLKLSAVFVPFIGGSSAHLEVGAANSSILALIVVGLIVTFVVGVVVGSLAGHFARAYRRLAILALVSALLAAASWLGSVDMTWGAIIALLLSMGAVHAVFEKDRRVNAGQDYVEGLQFKSGWPIGIALFGRDWMFLAPKLLLWLGFAVGVVCSVVLYPLLDLGGLWIASVGAALLALLVLATGTTGKTPPSAYHSQY
jgi:uncharacterized membrane protein YoaK (UPF0700 family)